MLLNAIKSFMRIIMKIQKKSGEAALNIQDVESHNPYIQTMLNLRVSAPDTLTLSIHYDLDTEHGMEFKFVNNQLERVCWHCRNVKGHSQRSDLLLYMKNESLESKTQTCTI